MYLTNVLMRAIILPLVLGSLASSLSAGETNKENFTRFRGQNGDGVSSDDPRLPETWSTTENVKWATDIPGWAWSCPTIWGDKVFLTTVVSEEENTKPSKGLYLGQGVRDPAKGIHQWLVYCMDINTGKVIWKKQAHKGNPVVPRHPKSTYGVETATTDGERLYVLFGDLGLFCYDLDGELLWQHNITPEKTFYDYGAAASPVVHGDQVIFVYDNQGQSYITSLDTKTGKVQWRTDRDERTTWATPYIWQNKQRTEIVVCGFNRNRSYDLDGNLLWEFNGRMSNLVIPSPFAIDGILYITSGYIGDAHRPVFAIRPGASGDITLDGDENANDYIVWYLPLAGPYNPSPIVYKGQYYTLYDRGFLTCHEAKTGKEIYGKRRFAGGVSFTSSPWAYNGKLFFLSEDGDTYVVKAGSEFEVIGKNSLGELCLSTPAVSQGKLFIRTATKLYCITNEQ